MSQPIVTAAEMRTLDKHTIEQLGLPGAILMEHAGLAVAKKVHALAKRPARVAVVCGNGGNGGDGFVCARWLREWGHDARVWLVAGEPKTDDAKLHHRAFLAAGGQVDHLTDPTALAGSEIVVDAILGTGLKSDVKGPLATVIERLNDLPAIRVAVDLPSGLDSDTGRVLGAAIRADHTVTFAFAKVAHVSDPGFARCGDVTVAEIGIPRALADRFNVKLQLTEEADARALLPPRPASGHKGTFGHLLVVAGSPGKTGAALLSATGALRAGAGLVTIATAPGARAAVDGRVPEAMTATLDLEAADAPTQLADLLATRKALACGPGIPPTGAVRRALHAAIPTLEVPMVLDADALNHLAGDLGVVASARSPVVLTPHPAEAAKLLGVSIVEVQADRVAMARLLAAQARAVVVLKGARTVVAGPDGRAAINPTGNPGMGTGGTGDVLTGVVGSLLAQGMDAFGAARLAVYVHGLAGDLARTKRGQMGLVAGDVAKLVAPALGQLGG